MDESVLEGVGRALKTLHAGDLMEQMPERWLDLLSQLDDRSEAGPAGDEGLRAGFS